MVGTFSAAGILWKGSGLSVVAFMGHAQFCLVIRSTRDRANL